MPNKFWNILCIVLFSILCTTSNAETQNFYKVRLACRYPLFCKKMGVRVKGIDAPEIRTKDPCEEEMAKRAKAFTKEFLKSGPIILRNCEKDKYFRLLCDVSVRNPNNPAKKAEKSLSEAFLAQKLAVLYDGGTKKSINWCEE